jgi:RNA polymerase sigma factor (sigma-70 family)
VASKNCTEYLLFVCGEESPGGTDRRIRRVRKALEILPVAFREVLVLREIEGLSYKEISDVTGIPMGTVMSSLSRARQRLRDQLGTAAGKEA